MEFTCLNDTESQGQHYQKTLLALTNAFVSDIGIFVNPGAGVAQFACKDVHPTVLVGIAQLSQLGQSCCVMAVSICWGFNVRASLVTMATVEC